MPFFSVEFTAPFLDPHSVPRGCLVKTGEDFVSFTMNLAWAESHLSPKLGGSDRQETDTAVRVCFRQNKAQALLSIFMRRREKTVETGPFVGKKICLISRKN